MPATCAGVVLGPMRTRTVLARRWSCGVPGSPTSEAGAWRGIQNWCRRDEGVVEGWWRVSAPRESGGPAGLQFCFCGGLWPPVCGTVTCGCSCFSAAPLPPAPCCLLPPIPLPRAAAVFLCQGLLSESAVNL